MTSMSEELAGLAAKRGAWSTQTSIRQASAQCVAGRVLRRHGDISKIHVTQRDIPGELVTVDIMIAYKAGRTEQLSSSW